MTQVVKYVKENPVEAFLAGTSVFLILTFFSHDFAFHIHTPLCPHFWVFGK